VDYFKSIEPGGSRGEVLSCTTGQCHGSSGEQPGGPCFLAAPLDTQKAAGTRVGVGSCGAQGRWWQMGFAVWPNEGLWL